MASIDPRIIKYREAAQAMKRGTFRVELPPGPDDEIAKLGHALRELGSELEKKFTELNTLVKVTEKINAGLVLEDVLNNVFALFRPIIPYHRIGFSLLEEGETVVRARWARSDAPTMQIGLGYSAPLAGSSLEKLLATGQPRILNDLEAYLHAHPGSDSTRRIVAEGMRSSLTCPLIALGRPIGFMFFSSMEPFTYKNIHVELFRQIAGQLAVIVEKGRLYQQMVELNELKNKFLGIAAHDLRNPLGVFKVYLQLLTGGSLGPLTDDQREVLQRMNRSGEGMLALINDLLDVSAIESGQLELHPCEVDLGHYLVECHAANRLLAHAKQIELCLELAPELPRLAFDSERITQAISNLLSNAIKFSFPGTVITLAAHVVGPEVWISVTDQGQGIPAEELPKVFTDFGRTSVRPTGGEKSTGLGLAIVKRMVEAHCGRIWVESVVGQGSTFTFALPLSGPAQRVIF